MYYEEKNNCYTMSKDAILNLEKMLEDGYNVMITDRGRNIEFAPYERPNSNRFNHALTVCIIPQESVEAIERLINTGFIADVKVESNCVVVVRIARKKISQATFTLSHNIAH